MAHALCSLLRAGFPPVRARFQPCRKPKKVGFSRVRVFSFVFRGSDLQFILSLEGVRHNAPSLYCHLRPLHPGRFFGTERSLPATEGDPAFFPRVPT
jgi:hypothetical protein